MLYERHAAAARALARQYVSPADAEDVVSDAFSKLFEMLRRGAGPDAGFRPYLYTVVRHRSFDVSRGAARTRPSTDDEIESVLGRVASDEDPALAGFERSVVSKAYFDLPERWREVLWYVLVDDLKPAQVAPVLGLSPNGVSALLYRAKEALRAGYLQQHLTHAPSDTCRSVNPLLGGYVRDSLSKRETTKIADHLATCGTCNALVLELHDVAHGMKTVIAPLVLGAGGLALVGAGAPIGGIMVAAKAGAGAAVGGAPAATATVGVTSAGTFSGAVSSAVSATAGAFASAAAAATGGSVAAGAIAVAAVSMVAALQIAGPADAEPVAADTVIVTDDGRELPGAEEINGKPVLPTDTTIEPDPSTHAVLRVAYTDASEPLAPRKQQHLTFSVSNAGEVAATGTQLQITLPQGVTMTPDDGPFGTGVGGRPVGSVEPSAGTDDTRTAGSSGTGTGTGTDAETGSGESSASGSDAGSAAPSDGEMQAHPSASPSEPATVGPIGNGAPAACTPTEQPNVLHCSLGELEPGQQHDVQVPVRAKAGGDYPIDAEVWADGLAHQTIELPSRTVAPFGPELSAATDDVSLGSPGTAALPVRVSSTGDRAVAAGWSVKVSLPQDVRPTSTQPELPCVSADLPNTWLCAPSAGTAASAALEVGETRNLSLNITTAVDMQSAAAAVLGAANISPVVPQGNAYATTSTLTATSAWVKAADGVGKVGASCLAVGGVGTAKAVVTGTYTNTTQRLVRVALQAAGSSDSSGKTLAPGDSTALTVHDGLRVPAGQAAFVLATDVDGQTYKTPVPAGDHQAADCYTPQWTTETSARTTNPGGTVTVEGTLTNTSNETLNAVMVVRVDGGELESVVRIATPGNTVNFSVNTGSLHVPEGHAVFRLSRDGVDEDGDPPAQRIEPKNHPKAHYDAALISPALGAAPVTGGTCEFDAARDRSVQMFAVTADNTKSTLPVRFHVGSVTRTVPAGETMEIQYPVDWGTETAELTAAGKTLDRMNVSFESCAQLAWPGEAVSVETAAQCSDDRLVQLTATVHNRTGQEWMGVLVRESSDDIGPAQTVPAGQTTTLMLTRQTPVSSEGTVTVRLARELEGRGHTVEWSFKVEGRNCLGAECQPAQDTAPTTLGGEWMRRWWEYGTCNDVTASRA
ncbi:sigma-70 family RNA polymerase sigma factor [Promicromonospora iranensis]|uniref:RNA polymerase sigma factor (Sigma-70 family) n=1 Tax=Promicromonospora iranensis TaxID=1105144 RepID=A0ABU2CQG3_9MICO|nr:sigma-70 family RNA polymerase sigma factor [Promicromonospora iranensis]MDR7383583.1 RNA polymerase sigma factor (sigma-70 family) [Promicromonospora iranensis]